MLAVAVQGVLISISILSAMILLELSGDDMDTQSSSMVVVAGRAAESGVSYCMVCSNVPPACVVRTYVRIVVMLFAWNLITKSADFIIQGQHQPFSMGSSTGVSLLAIAAFAHTYRCVHKKDTVRSPIDDKS